MGQIWRNLQEAYVGASLFHWANTAGVNNPPYGTVFETAGVNNPPYGTDFETAGVNNPPYVCEKIKGREIINTSLPFS